jgi:hypothetical protein
LIFDVLMPLSTIFQLYHGDQFYLTKNPDFCLPQQADITMRNNSTNLTIN